MSGGMIAHLLDSLGKQRFVQPITTHHEQAAAFAAEGMARATGIPGVAMATSGPGATNLLTGVGSCYFDSIPVVFITGQVNLYEQKGSKKVRQAGFQETDIVSMARPITKMARMIRSARELPQALDEAFRAATEGRPGPVLLDIPMNVQKEELSPRALRPSRIRPFHGRAPSLSTALDRLQSMLDRSARPLILAGGGIRSGNASQLFRAFARRSGIPVACSLLGVDAFPHTTPQFVGMIGSYGNRYANFAVAEADFILVLGSRLDVRQTGSNPAAFGSGKTIAHVDVDPSEINHRVKGCVAIRASINDFLTQAIRAGIRANKKVLLPWKARINEWKHRYPCQNELNDVKGINPNLFLLKLGRMAAPDTLYVSDVGQHQMWAAQSLPIGARQRFLTSGGMGAMGFGLPCAIGASLSNKRRPIVVIAGDGGFQTNIHELQTVMRNRLPLKMVLLNNRSHGMVRQFQQSYFASRFQSTVLGYSCPDFVKVALAYGIPAWHIRQPSEMERALRTLFRQSGPVLLEVAISIKANAYPKMLFGQTLKEMEPVLG